MTELQLNTTSTVWSSGKDKQLPRYKKNLQIGNGSIATEAIPVGQTHSVEPEVCDEPLLVPHLVLLDAAPRQSSDLTNSIQSYFKQFAEVFSPEAAERERWFAYLGTLAVDMPSARHVKSLWEVLNVLMTPRGRQLPVPVTVPGEDGSLHLAWDNAGHHLDIDVARDESIEWFYRDRVRGTIDGSETPLSARRLPRALIERLALVCR